ncbi:MAG: hypothetical protein DRP83_01460 [Planctomycetota bacterium]|nr:MAG: hypothetical protein DRP83_01460 [Planctomycetota bacterium]
MQFCQHSYADQRLDIVAHQQTKLRNARPIVHQVGRNANGISFPNFPVSDRIFWQGFLPFKQAAMKGRNIPAQGLDLG